MPTDTTVKQLIINELTKAQYDEALSAGEVKDSELYLIKDDDGDSSGGTFIATYGTTTSAEIAAAYQAGKTILCIKGLFTAVQCARINPQNPTFYFYGLSPRVSGYQMYTCSGSTWQTTTYEFASSTHASTHASDGSDPITPASIGAAPVSKSVTVTLSASAWDSTALTQMVAVTGVSATEAAQLITPTPALASQAVYYESGILCTGQAADSLTFTCTTAPTEDLTVYVVIQEVTQG